MATGITGTGEGFDAPSKGRLGGAGFGGHNPDVSQLRSKMVQVCALHLPCGFIANAGVHCSHDGTWGMGANRLLKRGQRGPA